MPSPRPSALQIRAARAQDLPDLLTLDQRVNGADGLSRRSFKRFLAGTGAVMLIAARSKAIAGYALVLFRPRCPIARLYALAVSPQDCPAVGEILIAAAETAARKRRCKVMRFAAADGSAAALVHCRKAGFADRPGIARRGAVQLEKPLYAAGAQP